MIEPVDVADWEVQHLVRSYVRGRFRMGLDQAGMDVEDVEQEVYVTILRRQASGSGWDPRRGDLATWLFVLVRTVVGHEIDKHTRASRRNGSPGERGDVALSESPDHCRPGRRVLPCWPREG